MSIDSLLASAVGNHDSTYKRITFVPAIRPDAHSSTINFNLVPLNDPIKEAAFSTKATKNAIASKSCPTPSSLSPATNSTGKRELFRAADVCLQWSSVKGIGPGLNNLGNTCFMNAVLQCLTHTPPLAEIFLGEPSLLPAVASHLSPGSAEDGGGGKRGVGTSTSTAAFNPITITRDHIRRALSKASGTTGGGGSISPKAHAGNLKLFNKRFRLGRQEDSHEFLRCLLDSMHEAYLKPILHRLRVKATSGGVAVLPVQSSSSSSPSSKSVTVQIGAAGPLTPQQQNALLSPDVAETTFIHRVFGGKLRSQLVCSEGVNYSSSTFETFLDLSLELRKADSIERALEAFTAPEVLDGPNKYRCPTNQQLVRAVKRITIHEAPNVLTLHLKRFEFGGIGAKISKPVRFPVKLNLQPYMSAKKAVRKGENTYALYGVLVHSGRTVNGGHYYCYVKGANGIWFCCDDDHVYSVGEKTVLEQQAYILFYIRDPIVGMVDGTANGSIVSVEGTAVKEVARERSLETKAIEDKERKEESEKKKRKGCEINGKLEEESPSSPSMSLHVKLKKKIKKKKIIEVKMGEANGAEKEENTIILKKKKKKLAITDPINNQDNAVQTSPKIMSLGIVRFDSEVHESARKEAETKVSANGNEGKYGKNDNNHDNGTGLIPGERVVIKEEENKVKQVKEAMVLSSSFSLSSLPLLPVPSTNGCDDNDVAKKKRKTMESPSSVINPPTSLAAGSLPSSSSPSPHLNGSKESGALTENVLIQETLSLKQLKQMRMKQRLQEIMNRVALEKKAKEKMDETIQENGIKEKGEKEKRRDKEGGGEKKENVATKSIILPTLSSSFSSAAASAIVNREMNGKHDGIHVRGQDAVLTVTQQKEKEKEKETKKKKKEEGGHKKRERQIVDEMEAREHDASVPYKKVRQGDEGERKQGEAEEKKQRKETDNGFKDSKDANEKKGDVKKGDEKKGDVKNEMKKDGEKNLTNENKKKKDKMKGEKQDVKPEKASEHVEGEKKKAKKKSDLNDSNSISVSTLNSAITPSINTPTTATSAASTTGPREGGFAEHRKAVAAAAAAALNGDGQSHNDDTKPVERIVLSSLAAVQWLQSGTQGPAAFKGEVGGAWMSQKQFFQEQRRANSLVS
eukprot:CAMPEP_0175050102 /NCGR_PEP_ID=MMETSP0052_2-20121109/7084_1 /TAXON_ID=51329 ORGANISM="Polytomella parva, Strain SAG 63-3" /NCGR_SAMPLE_ID=MMETSP0052_2 /ASSEMBLY_ACC=CAM_ASM_000194 /LENGTH=1138 /DNA_ID=CAMNT_0016314291 /DNA_START=99 /DNA_END=3512 /DNA_ORIENTATION=-